MYTLLIYIVICITLVLLRKRNMTNVYLINLEIRKDRLRNFLKNYNKSDLYNYTKLRRFNAINGNTLNISNINIKNDVLKRINTNEKNGYRTEHHQLTYGAIGCYLSHIGCWRDAFEKNNFSNVIIFEDDVKLKTKMYKTIHRCINSSLDWDIILLGGLCLKCTNTVYDNEFRKINKFLLLHAYIINKNCFEKIKKYGILFPIKKQIDFVLSDLCSRKLLNVYILSNNRLEQCNFNTDIQIPVH